MPVQGKPISGPRWVWDYKKNPRCITYKETALPGAKPGFWLDDRDVCHDYNMTHTHCSYDCNRIDKPCCCSRVRPERPRTVELVNCRRRNSSTRATCGSAREGRDRWQDECERRSPTCSVSSITKTKFVIPCYRYEDGKIVSYYYSYLLLDFLLVGLFCTSKIIWVWSHYKYLVFKGKTILMVINLFLRFSVSR